MNIRPTFTYGYSIHALSALNKENPQSFPSSLLFTSLLLDGGGGFTSIRGAITSTFQSFSPPTPGGFGFDELSCKAIARPWRRHMACRRVWHFNRQSMPTTLFAGNRTPTYFACLFPPLPRFFLAPPPNPVALKSPPCTSPQLFVDLREIFTFGILVLNG